MNFLQETAKGFFWTIGFVVISLGMYFIYSISIRAYLDSEYKEDMYKDHIGSHSDSLDLLEPEFIGYVIDGEKIVISSKAKNVNVFGNKFFLRLNIFTNNKDYPVHTCVQPLIVESGNPEYVFYQTICDIYLFDPSNIEKIEARIGMNTTRGLYDL